MPHGTPDFFGLSPKSYTYALQDDAELAVRLGSIVNFDRRGEVVFMTAFENGFGDFVFLSDDNTGSALWYLTGGLYKPTCIGISGDITDDVRNGLLWRSFVPPLGNYGVEVGIKNITYCRPFFLRYDVVLEGVLYRFEIQYSAFLGKLYYLDDTNSLVEIGSIEEGWYYPLGYSVIKLVINSSGMGYRRVIFNHRTFVLDDPSCYQESTGSDAGTTLWFGDAGGNLSTSNTYYISHVIITQNEPL